ncbi:hypothetical protein [Pseudodesulfovibrio sp. zrk46]|uniref:hypothetical protein n=1 Tax=Pseudodesulfovibrio sp. zrk46 TaxID=2725288 RepID=UPI001448E411|nr:hypothetical protein [Pseudodesulfovibrio sp. zrk46]QJB56168.1 hypothetical protein HFN16_06960 [Pseudodesulfovibrio sp. zrk46]
MLPLDVPFVAEGDYPDFLADHAASLASVHFSLSDPAMADARQRMESTDLTTLATSLLKLPGVPKYVLMNTRLHAPEKYFSPEALNSTASLLERLVEQAGINGIIFSDPYYLQALSDAHPDLAALLEAIPSVNAMIASAAQAFALIDLVAATRFQPPTKLVLDRNVNRCFPRLKHISKELGARRPNLKIHLIANEGCLLNCPYKPAHDAHVGIVNEGLCGDRTFAINRDLGCIRRFLGEPAQFLVSPFIRPEDTDSYAPMVDAIKLCGRNKGIPFLKRAVSAYISGTYDGNLLDLMDAMGDLGDQVRIPNKSLPADFLNHVTTCAKDCRDCQWCSRLADKIVERFDPGLPQL